MDRRQFLATTGGAVSLLVAGCRASESALEIGETNETAAGETITVADVHLRRSVLHALYGDVPQLVVPRDRQFVFLTLLRDGPDAIFPPATAFRLRLDDEQYRGASEVDDGVTFHDLEYFSDVIHPPPEHGADEERATVAFEIPLDATPDGVAIEWAGDDATAHWDWEDTRVRALRNPPRFRVDAVEFPGTFVCGDPFDVTVSVTNVGGRRDLFHAIVGPDELERSTALRGIVLPVPAGGTATWDDELEYPPRFGEPECGETSSVTTFELDWGTGVRRVTTTRRRGTTG